MKHLFKLSVWLLIPFIAGCVSYPTLLDKKLKKVDTYYDSNGNVTRIVESEHTPDTLAQESISNASPSGDIIDGCTFDMSELEETAQVAFAAARTPNPCLVSSSNANYFDAEINEDQVQGAIIDDALGATIIGVAIKTAGSVAKAGISKAGDDYVTGDISQSTNYGEIVAGAPSGEAGAGGEGGIGGSGEVADSSGGLGGAGGGGGAAAAGGNASGSNGALGNNSVNIGPASASSIAGNDAVSATGTKSGNEFIDDRDGVNESDVDASISLTVPVGGQ